MSFQNIKGQTLAARYIRLALEKNRLPHALLFLGPQQSGQRDFSKELAKALFCDKKKGVEGCDECPVCRQVDSGNHPDFRVFEPEQDTRVLKVDKVREMIGMAHLKPFQSPVKLFIIDRAEALNETAQNAILKTLEEPPALTYFVMICYAAETLLPTIRSRAQTVYFHPAARSNPAEGEPEKTKLAVWDRVAWSCLAQSGQTALNGSRIPDLSTANREDVSRSIEYSVRALRETLLMQNGCEEFLGEIHDRLQKEKIATSLKSDQLIQKIEILAQMKEKIDHSVNLKLALSVLWEDL